MRALVLQIETLTYLVVHDMPTTIDEQVTKYPEYFDLPVADKFGQELMGIEDGRYSIQYN